MSPFLQHLRMGLGLGGLGCLLVVGVRGKSDDAPEVVAPVSVEAPSDRPPIEDASPSLLDGAAPLEAGVDASPTEPPSPPPPPPPPPLFRVAQLAGDGSLLLADGTLGHRPFLTALTAAGLSRAEAYRVLRAVGKVRNMNHTSPTDAFHLAKEKGSGKVVAFEYVTSPVEVFQARDEAGQLVAKRLQLRVELKKVALVVPVTGDLRASVVGAGFTDEILPRIDEALDGHAEVSDLHPGARLRIVATEERLEGAFLRYASLDALEYSPAGGRSTPLRVYRFPPLDPEKALAAPVTRGGTYFDDKGQQPYHGGWRIPVPSARIASRFNPHRMHPTLHVVMPHNGVDFAAPTGTPIYAAASGTVKTAGDSGPCGNMVQVEHSAALVSSYCHMSRFAPGIHVGEHVETRQLLGYVGQTGRATGPHLHFAIKRNGIFIDPLAMKLDGVRVVPPSQRDAFDALRPQLDKALDAIAVEPSSPGSATADDDPGTPDGGRDAVPPTTDDTILDEVPMQ